MKRRRRAGLRWIVWLVCALFCAAPLVSAVHVVEARPGGGQSYQGGSGRSSGGSSSSPSSGSGSSWSSSGSSGSGSSGGGDVGGEFIGLFFQLLFAEPKLALALVVIVVIVMVVRSGWSRFTDWSSQRERKQWEAIADADARANAGKTVRRRTVAQSGPREMLTRITAFDPDFSLVLLDDFVQSLYVRVHEARGEDAMHALLPYLSDDARAALGGAPEQPGFRSAPVDGVDLVVIGAMRIVDADASADPNGGPLSFVAEIEANITERASGKTESFYVVERWTFTRARSARSRPFAHARSLDCPNCGGALKDAENLKCRYCSASVAPAEFDWMVARIEEKHRSTVQPTLTTYAGDVGASEPTVVTSGAQERLDAIVASDPACTWDALRERIERTYAEVNDAWSDNALERARAFVSDAFFRSQRYWMREYEKQGLRNVVKDGHVSDIHLAEVRSDRHYDAVTVRIFASAVDYVVTVEDGVTVAGDGLKPRTYSEYWTFVRGADVRGAPRTDRTCPGCGATLAVNQAGECAACKVHVTAGEFDWVLSRIEQDEAYEG